MLKMLKSLDVWILVRDSKILEITIISTSVIITACAIATTCCISDVPSQWEGRNFDPSQLPHFSTDLNET